MVPCGAPSLWSSAKKRETAFRNHKINVDPDPFDSATPLLVGWKKLRATTADLTEPQFLKCLVDWIAVAFRPLRGLKGLRNPDEDEEGF
jgi:hypothetical protein